MAVILACGYLESFCLEFSEVHGEAFVQGSVFFGGGGFCESGVGFGKFTDRLGTEVVIGVFMEVEKLAPDEGEIHGRKNWHRIPCGGGESLGWWCVV